jgi:hypothetical protein
MGQASKRILESAEKTVRDIRRATSYHNVENGFCVLRTKTRGHPCRWPLVAHCRR